jgi:hypothetical protein
MDNIKNCDSYKVNRPYLETKKKIYLAYNGFEHWKEMNFN